MDERERSREALLRSLWREILTTTHENVRNYPAADRAIAAGESVDDVVKAMRVAAYDTAFRLLYLIDSHHASDDSKAEHPGMGWALVEFDLKQNPSGPASALIGLHEDLMEADPSGRGGEDLWD